MTDTVSTHQSSVSNDESDEDASEAQAQVIASLRAQVTDLFSQVTQLNSKLVASYDRVSDLEDQLHDTSSSLRNASVTISSLELERSHHLAALNTGLLVEKAHVTAELNRLMERATEEAAQRGQAESARHDIEKDLDDLSATLFDQANTMVAEARLNRAKSERKLEDAEQALKIAEDAVKDMQVQMQSLQAEKEAAERDSQEVKATMGKGKWVEREDVRIGEVPRVRLMISHTPYAEFIMFITHLRGLRTSQPIPPIVSTLLSQPFLARLLAEDSEPTVRLDLAPSLNWLSRRSVLAAIHAGMLTVEPVSFANLVHEVHQHPQSMTTSTLTCALCGTQIARLPTTPVSRSNSANGSWFKYPLALASQNHNAGAPQSPECEPPGQVYVFRLAAATTSSSPSAPAPVHTSSASMSVVGTSSRPPLNAITSSRVLPTPTQNAPYPLCTSNYCLTRLRSTCSLWAFVRVGIVERIWEEEVIQPPKAANGDTHEAQSMHTKWHRSAGDATLPSASEKPPVPPRRRKLWEMASALGERVSWGKESGENTKEKEKESAKKLPIPLSQLPVPVPHAELSTSQVEAQAPPPLPKRNAGCDTSPIDATPSLSGTQNGAAISESREATNSASSPIDADRSEPDKPDWPDSPTPIHEIPFAAPNSGASPSHSSIPLPADTQPDPSTVQLHAQPSSPHAVPLPMTPTTPTPIQRVASPGPRPRSRVSSPASPPPNSRPASPALSHSRVGSPASSGTVRATPSSPGHPPSLSHIRGKTSVSSPLAPPRPASPAAGLANAPGAPPLPRRAAARRVAPPPPSSQDSKIAEEVAKEDASPPPAITADPFPEANAEKASGVEVPIGRENSDGEKEGGTTDTVDVHRLEGAIPQAAPVDTSARDVFSEFAKDVPPVDNNEVSGNAAEVVNGSSAAAVEDSFPSHASESDACVSVDTTGTKRSSDTDSGGFASDTTWEERTWKKVVRLKEAMFWARIGGVRALEG